MIDADIFGIAFFGDGATIHKCPLINLFASALHCPAVLINIIDCTARLVAGKRKMDALSYVYHKPYAFFMQHSKTYNKGRRVGLLRSAETRFASFFYAMHRALRCHEALESTVHSAQWKDLNVSKLLSQGQPTM
ncbi:hypothetical protein ACHAW5_001481 [Stephanodiscus triporus]|uniref:Uncharacterized protein n=1 Tax=Stephanodiscus triporus TaxID=2934178 RepID=A0ABD3MVB3_9STRA